ncbi:MAG: TolC family protein [Clostridium sp.]
MKKWWVQKTALAAGLTAAFHICPPLQAWAASPPFAYTEEEWAAIRDNKLEFEEIDKRIHEYNTTVRQNEISYKDYQGKDSSEIAQEYYDAAEEIYDSQPDLDPDSASYASDLASYISNEQRAESLKESGDASVEDEDTVKWSDTQAEKKLVSQAQSLMISYWNSVEKLSSLEQELLEAERSEELIKRKLAAGMAVQSEVLTAEQTVLNVRSEITSAESSLNETKTSLILMLGWNEGDSVEIGSLPEPDPAAIASVSLETDIEQALENNYDLKILGRR